MTIATTCRQCARAFDADRAAIVAGTWRLCPACRETPAATTPVAGAETPAPRRCQRCHLPIAPPSLLCRWCQPPGPGGKAA